MSARDRALLKKLRIKRSEEIGESTDKKEDEEDSDKEKIISTFQAEDKKEKRKNAKSVPKDINKNDKKMIDPLDYFKTEHIIIKESNMEEYSDAAIKKEVAEELRNEEGGEFSKLAGGVMGARRFKVNFEEMMKVRAKVKNEPQQKSSSVGTRNLRGNNNEQVKFEYVRKDELNKEDNLYIKLILAKNKLDKESHKCVYSDILKKIDELKGYTDMSEEMKKELNDIMGEIKLEKNVVQCSDVQIVSDDEDDSDPLGKKINLEQVINKMNIKGDM